MMRKANTPRRMRYALPARMTVAILSLTMIAGAAACEGTIPEVPSASSSTTASPDMSEAQEKQIRTEILDLIEKANESKQTDTLAQRMSGPALQIRTSEINIAKVTGNLNSTTQIPKDTTQVVIPTNTGWPRSIFAITTTTSDQQSKRLMVITQDSARSNYKLWGVARLFDGAQLPKFAVPQIGSQMGTARDSGLVASPTDAVAQYADVLQNGSGSKYAENIASDSLRQKLEELTQQVAEGMKRNNGTEEQVFTPAKDQIAVMRSTDGGDLVVAQIDSVWTRQAGEGRESQPANDAEVALFGDRQATSTMRVSYINVLAMYVPPAGSNQKITAVGAERQPVKIEAL